MSRTLLGIVARAAVILLFSRLALASYAHFTATGTLMSFGLVMVNALFVFFFVSRRQAYGVTTAPMAWVLGAAGTVLPLLLRPAEAGNRLLLDLGAGLQILGVASILAAMLSLSRSFGIVPANRGIRSTGLYALVRHPLYAADLIFLLGFVLSNPSGRNAALVALVTSFQVLRARREERFLTEDPTYRDYCGRVRYRFLPGLI